MTERYREFGPWLTAQLGRKVQKISINAGFSCPNRDGRVGSGGCTYCNNATFNPAYCNPQEEIALQLEAGKLFFHKKYPDMKFLAYFQAYTNTYATVEELRQKYEAALRVPDVVGIVIATRPDCLPPEVLDLLEEINQSTFLLVELGIESTDDKLLQHIHRGHDFACTENAVRNLAARGILVGGHIIFNLPNVADWHLQLLLEARRINSLSLTTLKVHQLQIVKGTQMATEYAEHPWVLPSAEEYIERIIYFVQRLRPDLVLERFVSQSPPELLAVKGWGLKNYEFTSRLLQRMELCNAWQGQYYDREKDF